MGCGVRVVQWSRAQRDEWGGAGGFLIFVWLWGGGVLDRVFVRDFGMF